jgi:hypothetical protein
MVANVTINVIVIDFTYFTIHTMIRVGRDMLAQNRKGTTVCQPQRKEQRACLRKVLCVGDNNKQCQSYRQRLYGSSVFVKAHANGREDIFNV